MYEAADIREYLNCLLESSAKDPSRVNRMNILFLTQVLPYPLSGGQKIRAYYMLRYLTQSHRVTLVSFTRDDDLPEYIEHLKNYCSRVVTAPMKRSRLKDFQSVARSIVTHSPIVILRDELSEMSRIVRMLVSELEIDAIHADQISMAQYATRSDIRLPDNRRPLLILDQHNALFRVVARQSRSLKRINRLIWNREARLLADYERRICRQFDAIMTVSDKDREDLLLLYRGKTSELMKKKFTTIPICVDPNERSPVAWDSSTRDIIHIGSLNWPPNIEAILWFAQKVFPIILARYPDTTFTIVGREPPKVITQLAEQPNYHSSQIQVTGFVAQPESLLAQSRAFIVPVLAGSGMRVKILDAWLWGVPVISTSIGAEGLKIQPGRNILIADEPETFANEIMRLRQDFTLASRLRDNGRKWVEKHYNWHREYTVVEKVYESAALGH